MKTNTYLIDGVRVSAKIYWRRMEFGEHATAQFRILERMPKPDLPRR